MASQYGTTRYYSDKTVEAANDGMTKCPLCHVNVVPRGISASRVSDKSIGTHCPNCGHVFTPKRPPNPAEGMSFTAGTQQVETATVVAAGGITTAGTAKVIFTGARVPDGEITLNVELAEADTAAEAAGKIAAALAGERTINNQYIFTNPEAAPATIVCTVVDKVGNDSTLNISIENGTCVGITKAATSANTTAGVAPVAIS